MMFWGTGLFYPFLIYQTQVLLWWDRPHKNPWSDGVRWSCYTTAVFFQVPKLEGFLNHIFGYFGGWIFPYISRIHTAYIGEYEQFVNFYVCSPQRTAGITTFPRKIIRNPTQTFVASLRSARTPHEETHGWTELFFPAAKYDLDYDGVVGM